MEQSLQGDARAYEQLLALLTVGLRRVVRRRAHSARIEVEDIVQEVLLALHLKRETWVMGTPLAPWVAAIARNKVVDALRRRGQRVEVSSDSIIEALVGDCSEPGPVGGKRRARRRLSVGQRRPGGGDLRPGLDERPLVRFAEGHPVHDLLDRRDTLALQLLELAAVAA